jgi:hypothetical protein
MTAVFPELSARDKAILRDLARVRLLTGHQLERLHFADLVTANARGSTRRRVLGRLASNGLVTALPRRVGGVRAGSAGLVYVLDSRAHRSRGLWDEEAAPSGGRVRRPWAIGWPFVAHSLDVAELYVRLRERERGAHERLHRFDAEPASWYPTAHGTLKPDAYAVFDDGPWEQHRWIEVDRGTESMPTLRRKLTAYAELAARGDAGPLEVLPAVLVTVPDERRRSAVLAVVAALVTPSDFISVQRFDTALMQAGRPPP